MYFLERDELVGHTRSRAFEPWTFDGADRSCRSVRGERAWLGDSAGGGDEGAADAVSGDSEGHVERQQLLAVRR